MYLSHVAVTARTGELHALPVWRSLLELDVKAGSWTVGVDLQEGQESLNIDLLCRDNLEPDQLWAELRASVPTAISVEVSRPAPCEVEIS
ncbi:hypothetical protein NDK50_15075 [Paraburkholderia bryophila]|uniref:hypothetical protein n=1 Tax=Paraburkholderia bryophila TaxID=420952 RepID=UPI00234B189D|nr:hypothetical protein [Paraburkholderia bryophila]WCM18297.1 hypothetical protein NDK50_12555 [Paraburkholderia bryophila]WCM18752.1 hypothetical protein NDK50_15075 [Paraburkholderia bryophila]